MIRLDGNVSGVQFDRFGAVWFHGVAASLHFRLMVAVLQKTGTMLLRIFSQSVAHD